MNIRKELLLLWAKTGAGHSGFHPLLCHMLDVGQVARALWREALAPAGRAQVAQRLQLGEAQAERWVAFWAGLHDIGKASPAFAFKNQRLGDALVAAGFIRPGLPDNTSHGIITTCSLREILPNLGLNKSLVSRISVVLGGHHGQFPDSTELHPPNWAVGGTGWKTARRELALALAACFEIAEAGIPGEIDNPTAMFLAGLVSVADWIGSAEESFGYAFKGPEAVQEIDAITYAINAEGKARAALEALGWTGWDPPAPATFGEIFPGLVANSLQNEIVSLAESLDGPALVLVEAPMGEGKTEAAMYLADRWAATGVQRGCYFALPTQATSNQMFGRVREFLTARHAADRVNLQLVHGYASLSPAFQELRRNEERFMRLREVYGTESRGTAGANVVAAEWFTHRKRPLLAPFGVGTVDQALLAVLQTHHVFVRLFGLTRKVLVIDEVHAYDTYMSALLEQLLEWVAALGSSVILLSATLPEARRRLLLSAYDRGLQRPLGASAMPAASYPRLSWTSPSGAGARTVKTSERSAKSVRLTWIDGSLPSAPENAFPLGEKLRVTLADGGCTAVICNTVARAQQVYRSLKPYFTEVAEDGHPELDLLHARYPFEERNTRETRCMVRFGKPDGSVTVDGGTPQPVWRPRRAVLVATQIVEQSLDLDFDLMVTDLAPVDLVLQRVGRLQRHARPRPTNLADPALWVLAPALDQEGVPIFKEYGKVYDAHVLLRSWLTLIGASELSIPGGVEELIEAVYGDQSDLLPGANAATIRRLKETRRELAEQARSDTEEAERRWLKKPGYEGSQLAHLSLNPREEDAPDFHREHQALTRLTEPTVQVVCLYGSPDRPFIDADRTRAVDLAATPTLDAARSLLVRSLAVSDKRIVFSLMSEGAPPGWRKSPLLRHCRLLAFDADLRAVVGNYRVRLDEEIGLAVE